MTLQQSGAFTGPVFLSYGFRAMFLLAMIFATGVIPAWILILDGHLLLPDHMVASNWHVHELLFGYTSAVIAGFLLTAVPNWTGRPPIRGGMLALLAVLWIAGRLAIPDLPGVPLALALVADNGFMLLVAALTLREVILGRNWRNLIIMLPLVLFIVSDVLFHLSNEYGWPEAPARRLGLSTITVLIMLISGRIIPAFTRNWLAAQKIPAIPPGFGRFDALATCSGVVALGLWTGSAPSAVAAPLLLLASGMHFVRLFRWRGIYARKSAILAMLHIAYLCIPVGLMMLAVSEAWPEFGAVAGIHMLAVGGIGGMTCAMMIRVSLGHTGRPLAAGPMLTVAFTLIILSAIFRSLLPDVGLAGVTGLEIAALFWTAGFVLLNLKLVPYLFKPRVG